MKHRTKSRVAIGLVAAIALMTAARARGTCEGVTYMPTEVIVTRAKDLAGLPSDKHPDETQGLVDIHTFNHFYTFQIDRDVNERNEGVVMDLVTADEKAASPEGFAFRLRAEFNSAEASRAGMGFRVTLGYKVHDATGYIVETVA